MIVCQLNYKINNSRKRFFLLFIESAGTYLIPQANSYKKKDRRESDLKILIKCILENEDFDIDKHLTLINKNKQGEDQKYSTPYTLLDLDYDTEDVVERLKELTIAEYAETKIDKDDLNPPLLFVFGKDINSKLVYVKLKIKGDEQRHVLCVSFHYAKEKMTFPYI